MKKFSALLREDLYRVVKRLHSVDIHGKVLAFLILLYITYFTWASFLRFDNFYTGRFDLGNMVQTVWNTTQGRMLAMTNPDGIENISRFAFHGDFFLVFLAPLYALWPGPKLLLLLQTVVLSLGAVFVYKLSIHILRGKNISIVFAAAFLLNPSIQMSNLYDFHPVVLATTFLLGAFYFMKQKRYWWFLLFAFLAGSTKEQVWAIIGLFGVFIFVRALYSLRIAGARREHRLRKEAVFGFLLAAISFALFFAFFSYIIPTVRGGEHFATVYFSEYGNSAASIIRGVLSSPSEVISTIVEPDRRSYIRELFLPLAYLSVFSPLYLLFASPDLMINLLSSNANLRQIYYQYTATITPFLFISAIYGVRLLRYFVPKLSFTFFTCVLLLSTLYCAYLYGPLPFARNSNTVMFSKRPNVDTISSYLQTIPSDATVSASNQLGSHLSERETIYVLPNGIQEADYVLFLLSDSTAGSSTQMRDLSDKLKNNRNHILIFQHKDFIVFKKNRLSSFFY